MTTDYQAYLGPLGRVLMATLFLLSGFGKVAAPNDTIGYIASTGAPFPTLGLAIALVVELGASTFLLLGYRARAAAAVLALYCSATALMFHTSFADPNQMIHFFKDIALAGGFLQIVALGAGSFTLDTWLCEQRS